MIVVIRGAGDLATGIALRLYRSGYQLVMTDLPEPTAIRRTVCFSEAIRQGETEVEGVRAVHCTDAQDARNRVEQGLVAVLGDPAGACISALKPGAVVDAILAKKNLGTAMTDAPVVIGVGPGFTAGVDCHAAVETKRGHYLGRLILAGSAIPNTGVPGDIGGYSAQRIIRATADGIFEPEVEIGQRVETGALVARVDGTPVYAAMPGMVRGMLPAGLRVTQGMKAGDIDSRCEYEHCFTVSDKARAVGGGVLEGLLYFQSRRG